MKSSLKKLFLNYLDKKGLQVVKKYKMPTEASTNEKKIPSPNQESAIEF